MISGFFPDDPDEPDDPDNDTAAGWYGNDGDRDGWRNLSGYPHLEPAEVLTPDLDRALDAILAGAHLDPLPEDTWTRLLTTAFTSPDPGGDDDGEALPDDDGDLW
jgi:hypothetical protein